MLLSFCGFFSGQVLARASGVRSVRAFDVLSRLGPCSSVDHGKVVGIVNLFITHVGHDYAVFIDSSNFISILLSFLQLLVASGRAISKVFGRISIAILYSQLTRSDIVVTYLIWDEFLNLDLSSLLITFLGCRHILVVSIVYGVDVEVIFSFKQPNTRSTEVTLTLLNLRYGHYFVWGFHVYANYVSSPFLLLS